MLDIDPRFGLSQDQLIQISQQAADIWKQGTGQDYFTYDPNAKLEIRLVYDNSQSRSEQRQKLQLSSNKNSNVIDEQQQIKQLKQLLVKLSLSLKIRSRF